MLRRRHKKIFCTVKLLRLIMLIPHNFFTNHRQLPKIKVHKFHWGSHNSTLLFPMKTENTVTWFTIMWYWELFKYYENIVQTRGRHTSEWGTKGMKRVSSDAKKGKLEAQGPCTGHRSIIAILYCFSFKYMKREKGRDLTQYTNWCGLNTLPHQHD